MVLDRKTVDETAGLHIRQLQDGGAALTDEDRRRIRKEHERLATEADRQHRKRRHRKDPAPMRVGQHTARARIVRKD